MPDELIKNELQYFLQVQDKTQISGTKHTLRKYDTSKVFALKHGLEFSNAKQCSLHYNINYQDLLKFLYKDDTESRSFSKIIYLGICLSTDNSIS